MRKSRKPPKPFGTTAVSIPDPSVWDNTRAFFINLMLVAAAALLFALMFPNPIFAKGLPFLAWIAYVPIFALIKRVSLAASPLWGALYGYASYTLFNYWLSSFHPLAGIIVGIIYSVFLAAVFFFFKLADTLFPRRGYIVQWLIWLAYEYLRTLGFLGYSYGITGYSQWSVLPVIQIASIFGVWGVSALTVFPSAWLGAALGKNLRFFSRKIRFRENFYRGGFGGKVAASFRAEKIPAFVWTAALAAALVYGFAAPSDFSDYPHVNIALIQHNTDPWRGGLEQYRNNFYTLRRLSDEALASEPRPDMVVWSETAFVPSIYWHERFRADQDSWLLVRDLLNYLARQEVPFVIGGNDARRDPSRNPNPFENHRVNYNAALLFENGQITGVYRKIHLVPFTEHFPYARIFPRIYRWLRAADTHFWERGTEKTVFSGPGFYFSTPICFEDTFGYLSRDFVRNGADVLVNLSNDAWANSLSAQNQHLTMAVFRSVENRRSTVRATSSGQTCGIAPNGRIIAMAEPFTEAFLTVAIPVKKGNTTIYTRFGDFLGVFFTVAAVTALVAGGVIALIKLRQ